MPDRILRRRFLLADGSEIRTTNEALLLIDQRLGDVRGELIERTRALLATAAQTGRRADIKAAGEAMASVLCESEML